MVRFREVKRAAAVAACVILVAPVAGADVRVWTDREEVILKGTLKGLEVVPDGTAKRLPPAPRDKALPGSSAVRTGKAGEKLSVADLARKLPAGGTVILKKGTYLGGTLNRAVTVKCESGVRISGAGQKAALRIDATPVVIDGCDFLDSRREMNSAGIWGERRMRSLTIRNARFYNNGNGIIVGNIPGAVVAVEDSVFDRNGAGGRAHQIYMSGTDTRLIVKRTVFRNTAGDGHVIKTGARLTVLEDVKILGSGEGYSRAIDAFAGGDVQLIRVEIEHGPNANSDIIGFGAEAARSPERTRHRLSFQDVTVKCLRQAGCTLVQSWLAEPQSISGVTVTGGRVALDPFRK